MQTVNLKKGHRFSIAGEPQKEISVLPDPKQVALLPAKIGFIKPRLKVAQEDMVSLGSPLVEDKRNPAIRLLSPGGGTISHIQFGPRRRIEAIVVDINQENESQVEFGTMDGAVLAAADRDQLVSRILEGGLWWVFKELPFRDLPHPETVPPKIIVGLSSREPFQPVASVYLQDRENLLTLGIQALQKLTNGSVMVVADAEDRELLQRHKDLITHTVKGNYPCHEPGTLNYHAKRSADENRAWMISGQDVLLLAQLLSLGRYPTERIIAVGGSRAPHQRYMRTRLGAPLAHLIQPSTAPPDTRWVVGGLMQGYSTNDNGFMGLRETSLTLLPEGQQAPFLALFNPGFGAPSHSRVFFSKLNTKPLIYDCNLKGDERACIACMYCADVCPVDILPHMTYKAVLAEEVEEYLEHGLLDCTECGLCSYVCPSKIELSQTFIAAKAAYAKERPKPELEKD